MIVNICTFLIRHIAVFPSKLRIIPQFIFNSRDPIVMGVTIEAGILKQGTPMCVPSKSVSLDMFNPHAFVHQKKHCQYEF